MAGKRGDARRRRGVRVGCGRRRARSACGDDVHIPELSRYSDCGSHIFFVVRAPQSRRRRGAWGMGTHARSPCTPVKSTFDPGGGGVVVAAGVSVAPEVLPIPAFTATSNVAEHVVLLQRRGKRVPVEVCRSAPRAGRRAAPPAGARARALRVGATPPVVPMSLTLILGVVHRVQPAGPAAVARRGRASARGGLRPRRLAHERPRAAMAPPPHAAAAAARVLPCPPPPPARGRRSGTSSRRASRRRTKSAGRRAPERRPLDAKRPHRARRGADGARASVARLKHADDISPRHAPPRDRGSTSAARRSTRSRVRADGAVAPGQLLLDVVRRVDDLKVAERPPTAADVVAAHSALVNERRSRRGLGVRADDVAAPRPERRRQRPRFRRAPGARSTSSTSTAPRSTIAPSTFTAMSSGAKTGRSGLTRSPGGRRGELAR